MRNISSAVLSLAAMSLSSLTTYLTFFDARYTLTQAVAEVPTNIQGGGGTNSDGTRSASYRIYPEPRIILSNRGTRALVLSSVEAVVSSDPEKCVPMDLEGDDAPYTRKIEPVIVEPSSVQQIALELGLAGFNSEAAPGEDFDFENTVQLWCLKWVVFDPNGERREPLTPLLTLDVTFSPPEEGESYPDINVEVDHPKEPSRLVTRGLY